MSRSVDQCSLVVTTDGSCYGQVPAAVRSASSGDTMTRQGWIRCRPLSVVVITSLLLGSAWALGSSPASATDTATSANSVVVWDGYAQTAIWDVAQQAPQVQGRSFAIVHGAIYDAVNAIAGTPYQPYLVAPRARGSESVGAAVATAAYQTLVFMFPEQRSRLTAQYDQYLAGIPDSPARRGGVGIGGRAAAAMVAARRGDGAVGPHPGGGRTQPGPGRPAPPAPPPDGARGGPAAPVLIRQRAADPAPPAP